MRAGPITVTWVPAVAPGPPQVAYAVGRKVGGAVVRNRLRRRLRSIAAECSSWLRPGAYLVGAAPDAATLSFEELRLIVSDGLRRAPGKGSP